MRDIKENIFKRFKNSIYDGSINPKEEHNRLNIIIKSLVLHLHPPKVNEKVLKFNQTFGLGGMAIVLICIQFLTGLLLRFFYEPFPGRAYDSILHLQNNVLFGQLLRNIHYWSAVFLIVITFLHLLRVFFTSAFHGKRQFNWVIGIALFLIIIFSNFTGYLLPWDQLSYWAVTVSTSMLDYIPLIGESLREIVIGGSEIGNATLLIFYNFHTGILPIFLILLMAFHFWRVRKAGGIVVPETDKEDNYVSTVPHLVAKEFVVAIVLIAVIFLFAISFNAPLLAKANPNVSPNPAKAPWYFMGIQELMLHFHPLFSAIIIPLSVILLAVILPYFIYETKENGRWFYSDKAKSLVKSAIIISVLLTTSFILIDEYILKSVTVLGFLPDIISNGIIPFIFILLFFFGYSQHLIKRKSVNKNELVQTLFIFTVSTFTVLTIVGVFFRGEGMALTFF
jgi:quinol-cytochrome oxidoreductase complex cytochrome b subunit